MIDVRISLVTISFNAEDTIQKCINSVISQSYKNVEYLVIDGNSSDSTSEIIRSNMDHIDYFKSESDKGIYDAMNKGAMLATGDVLGFLNADDFFANDYVLSDLAAAFVENNCDILYADLDYVNTVGKIVRRWRSGSFARYKFNFGWMPPHPTFYAKTKLYHQFGLYNASYGTAADYELMLRFMFLHPTSVYYLNKVIVRMKTGGVSNRNLVNRGLAWKYDLKAMKTNKIMLPPLAIFLKPLRKIFQFIS